MAPFTAKSTNSVATAPRRAVLAAMISCCCGMVKSSFRRMSVVVSVEANAAGQQQGSGGGIGGGGDGSQPAVGSVPWLLEVMVACIVFYDRAHHSGSVFTARDVPIKKCIACIRKHGGESRGKLLTSIRYSTLHFSAASSSIQSSVECE